jgi:tetratricopeptide (TPR) repeat protein
MLLSLLAPAPAALAQENVSAEASASVKVAPKTPAELRAEELDRLFGQLHRDGAEPLAATAEKKIWDNWARNDSITAEVLLGQASKAMNAQEYETAEIILDRLLEAQPAYAEAWNRRATLNFLAKRYEKSLADIEKVLELEPRHFGALSGRGMILEAMDKPDEALAAYREALTMNPYMRAVEEKVKMMEKARPDI